MLDHSDEDAVDIDLVMPFLRRSKLSEALIQQAWTLASNKRPRKQLHRQKFFVCLKLIALAQHTGGVDLAPLVAGLCMPLPDFGLRSVAAPDGIVPDAF